MRSVLVTPCFCRAELFRAQAETLKDVSTDEKWVLDNHYPLGEYNSEKLKNYAAMYGYEYFDSGGDLGLHGSLNNFYKHRRPPPGTIHINVDPDSTAPSGFDAALVGILFAEPVIAVAALWNDGIDLAVKEKRVYLSEATIGRQRVGIHPSVEMINIAAFNMDFVSAVGGFDQRWDLYGGIEAQMFPKWKEKKMRLAYALDFKDSQVPGAERFIDPEYVTWKRAHLRGFKGGLAEWMHENPSGSLKTSWMRND